ncbi:hypothetical protein TRICI_005535 [Trichomonascus ciferrii]|uniref:Uncharacterized protein n=1 Tax=Trichomonascus ciferrii TaxID=44093 RepID=A0A642US70_9ASCO|nr:hypothetical protein TRICI_005535 [Trichomonascus ciferrii]
MKRKLENITKETWITLLNRLFPEPGSVVSLRTFNLSHVGLVINSSKDELWNKPGWSMRSCREMTLSLMYIFTITLVMLRPLKKKKTSDVDDDDEKEEEKMSNSVMTPSSKPSVLYDGPLIFKIGGRRNTTNVVTSRNFFRL